MTSLLPVLILSGTGTVPPGTAPPVRTHTGCVPYGKENHGIEGSISPQTTIRVTEGDYLDELVTGSDTDEWAPQANILASHQFYGNSAAVSIRPEGQESEQGYTPSGDLSGYGYVSYTDASVTIRYQRKAAFFNAPVYPVERFDRYSLTDNQPHSGGVVPYGWQLWDPEVIHLVSSVLINKKTTSPGGGD